MGPCIQAASGSILSGKRHWPEQICSERKNKSAFSSLSEQELNSLWQSGNIWKEQAVQDLLLPLDGRAESKVIYIDYGSNETFRIPVQPVPLRLLKNGPNIEGVSFYLGFSIAGLLAYNTHSLSLKQ